MKIKAFESCRPLLMEWRSRLARWLFGDPPPPEVPFSLSGEYSPVPEGLVAEAVNYYEDQITRLSLAWLAARTGNSSEFGYMSQAEIVTALAQEVSSYQKHARALRERVESAQSSPPAMRLSALADGATVTTPATAPSLRLPICEELDLHTCPTCGAGFLAPIGRRPLCPRCQSLKNRLDVLSLSGAQ